MRCPACGARNSADAAWCTQCYAAFRDPVAPDPAAPDPGDEERDQHLSGPAHGTAPGDERLGDDAELRASDGPHRPPPPPPPAHVRAAARGGGQRDVREREGVVEWRCATCDGWNVLEADRCRTCGTARRGFGEPAAVGADLDERRIVGASLVLPGLGHVLAGRAGTGAARALLALLWLLGGLAFVVGNPGAGGLPGWLLLVGAAVLWVMTAVDAQRLVAGDERQLLATRGLAALVVAVTLGLVASVGVVVLAGR